VISAFSLLDGDACGLERMEVCVDPISGKDALLVFRIARGGVCICCLRGEEQRASMDFASAHCCCIAFVIMIIALRLALSGSGRIINARSAVFSGRFVRDYPFRLNRDSVRPGGGITWE